MLRRLSVVALALALSAALAGAGETVRGFPITTGLGVVGQYVTHGFDVGNDKPSFQPYVTVGTPLAGVTLQFWSSFPFQRSAKANDELDFILKYNHTFLASSPWATAFSSYVDYWRYPSQFRVANRLGAPIARQRFDGLKWHLGAAWPKLLSLGGRPLVPSYCYYHWLPVDRNLFTAGGVHELGLAWSRPLPRHFAPKGQTLDLATTVNYHTGVFGTKADWSHATFVASTTFVNDGFTVTPSLNYQCSFGRTVDREDEVWAGIAVATSF